MLQPKSKVFKLKFHLAKVEASNNKVNSRVHAYLMIDNQQLQFQGAPELKKNIAIFGSDLQYENFMIGYDQVTGLYEDKRGLVVIEFETMGAYIKVGEVSVNLGEILNEKKYRVVNVYQLSKCYDKTAKIKLAVDFVPQTRGSMQQGTNNNKRTMAISSIKQTNVQTKVQGLNEQVNNSAGMTGSGYYKNPTGMIKSRLAQEENVILQERIYEYEKRMDNYRNAQNQLSEKMQQQMQRKDEKISELSLQVSKLQNSLHLITLQSESLKVQIKSLNQQKQYKIRQCKQFRQQISEFQKKVLILQKQVQSKSISIQNMNRTRQNKQRHLNGEIQKYTLRYSQSQQQRNKIIFQLQNKLKIQLQKKDHHYQQLLNTNQSKYLQTIKSIKQRNKYLQTEYKQLQQLSQQQQNKLKALTLQLSKSLTMNKQREQQMVYMNQQSNKLIKLNQTLSSQIDSLNFSYQQSITQLTNVKQLNKQLSKKLQNTKTQLSLSNQTITQLNQRITLMNKQLQVHSQREYYMKEHYQEQLYDMELVQNNIKTHNEQLQTQLIKHKQQLKLTQQKLQEEQNKYHTLKTTLDSYQKQLNNKNSLLIKLNQQKIYLETTNKNHLNTIQQLQLQITHLQKQKIYLSQNLMEKKISLDNQKSLQWTYKIQSLQNDIQVLVDKFRLQKQTLKEQHKKQQQKKNQEINKLTTQNKKIKQDIDDLRDKLTKRQNYLINVQKSLKIEKEKSIDLQRQLNSFKQTLRAVNGEKQSYEQSVRDLSRQKESYIKSISELETKSQRQRKELSSIKISFHRLISMILEYMVKRYSERVSFQQISVDGVDTEMMGYVNVALKKYCQEHNRTRDLIKQLQEWKKEVESEGNNLRNIKSNNNSYDLSLEKDQQTNNYYSNNPQKYHTRKSVTLNRLAQQQLQDYDRKSIGRNQYPNRAFSPGNRQSLNLQLDSLQNVESYRVQIDRLKKEQSQYRVKLKSQQQEIQKQQRIVQNIKFQTNRLKGQLQQSQDQLTRIGFVLRKKDKIIKQLQGQLQQLQKQNIQLKSNPQYVIQKARQKISSSSNQQLQQSPSSYMAIRDLQSRLNLKQQQLSHVQKQLQTLRTQYLTQLNNIKKLQSKLKQKTQKVVSLQKQLEILTSKQNDNKDKQNARLKKQLSQQQQEKYLLQEKNLQLQSVIKQLQIQLSNLQQRNKQLHQQFKSTQLQFRRNLQTSEYQMNDKSTFYQTQIMQLKSQLSQLQDKVKQLTHKNTHLTQFMNRKNTQLQAVKDKLSFTEKQMLKNQQINDQYKNKMLIKSNTLNDRIRELQSILQTKQFQLEQCKFAYQGRVLDLQRQIDDFINTPIKATPNINSP